MIKSSHRRLLEEQLHTQEGYENAIVKQDDLGNITAWGNHKVGGYDSITRKLFVIHYHPGRDSQYDWPITAYDDNIAQFLDKLGYKDITLD